MLWRSFEIAEISSVEEMGRASGNITDVLIFAAGRYDEAGDLGVQTIGPVDAPTSPGVAAAIQSADIVLARYLRRRWARLRQPWCGPTSSPPAARARSRSASGLPSWPSAVATSKSRSA